MEINPENEDLHAPNTESKKCPSCDRNDFVSEMGMKQHHKRTHGESIAGVEVICDFCGDETRTRPNRLTNDHHFCNQECEGEWRSDYLSGDNGPLWKGGKINVDCYYCGGQVKRYLREVEASRRTFCDASCRGQWRSENWTKEDLPRWDGGPLSITCYNCGEEFERKRSQVDRAERQFCSRECFGIWRSDFQRGPKNPSWTGGVHIRVAVRNLIGSQPWKYLARQERESECEICSTKETGDGRALSVHHTIPVMAGGCNESPLLMTLCNGCHRKAEAYTRKFTEPILTHE